jgi:arabinogalactan oligomer / maltooligosaccharide transport system permease protein
VAHPDALDEGERGDAVSVQMFTSAAVAVQRFEYDETRDVILDLETGTDFVPEEGTYTAADGTTLSPGYRDVIRWTNYERVLSSPAIRGPFLRVFLWTFVFAVLSVVSSFVMGLGSALALNDPRMKFRRVTRSLLIVPDALPSFMTGPVWQGLLNTAVGPTWFDAQKHERTARAGSCTGRVAWRGSCPARAPELSR